MEPQLVGHPPLALPCAITEIYCFQTYNILNYYWLVICVMMYDNTFKKIASCPGQLKKRIMTGERNT